MVAMSPRKAIESDSSTFLGRFAARLKHLRVNAGMDHKQAASAITRAGYKVSVQSIYKWEQGTRQPHPECFPSIAKAYDTKVRFILPAK